MYQRYNSSKVHDGWTTSNVLLIILLTFAFLTACKSVATPMCGESYVNAQGKFCNYCENYVLGKTNISVD